MKTSRREFLRQSGGSGLGLLTFSIAGCDKELTAKQAREQGVAYRVFSTDETAVVDTLGDILVPGSADAGLSHYIDHQLAATAGDCMLMIKYLGVPSPYDAFYKGAVAALDGAARVAYATPFAALSSAQAGEIVAQMAANEVDHWEGPPADFFMFVMRSDAADVYYGTMQGFEKLGTPYMAHIQPPSRWGE